MSPSDPVPYAVRAADYSKLGDEEKSKADIAKAKELGIEKKLSNPQQ